MSSEDHGIVEELSTHGLWSQVGWIWVLALLLPAEGPWAIPFFILPQFSHLEYGDGKVNFFHGVILRLMYITQGHLPEERIKRKCVLF